MLKDDSTLRDIKLTKGAKMMVIGSTIQDVLTVAPPDPESTKPAAASGKDCKRLRLMYLVSTCMCALIMYSY